MCRYVAAKTRFFQSQISLPTLENRLGVLETWCDDFILGKGQFAGQPPLRSQIYPFNVLLPTSPASQVNK